ITVNVEGARVACNEREVGTAPLTGEVFVEAGATSVVVRAEGHKDARRTVALAKGETKALEITLETDPNAGAVVPVGPSGGSGGTGGTSGTEPAGGAAGNGASADANGGVDTGGMSTKTVVVIAGSALTAIGLGVGIGFMLDSNSADDDANSNFSKVETTLGKNGCAGNQGAAICKDLNDSLERRDSSKQLSTVGFIGFGVFGAGTLAALLLWPEEKSESARPLGSQFAFAPTKGGARASFTAQF
ncbi:MAG TPA: PEGA domain-containing protein, partial [Polyangiaceae bacterium]|nr:PEGA domain-containing protein [Polyangiaceae bacterium]